AEILECRREVAGVGRTDPINTRAEALFHEILTRGRSFWTEAYEPYMARDLNRKEIRTLIQLGLEYTRGRYTMLVSAFNMPPQDYMRFLTFLRKQRCHVPFQQFRVMPNVPEGDTKKACRQKAGEDLSRALDRELVVPAVLWE